MTKSGLKGVFDGAKAASRQLATLTPEQKTNALLGMADSVRKHSAKILIANKKDLENGRRAGLSNALLDRLELTETRIADIANAIMQIARLKDPVGEVIKTERRPNGLNILKIRVPIGVIGVIYESRPNVTADAAALCIKSGNAVILRGGKEALESNLAITEALVDGAAHLQLHPAAVQFVADPDKNLTEVFVGAGSGLDLVILRGGERLITEVTKLSHVPVMKHYKGVCHIFVDESADLEAAVKIVENAKCQRPGVCNAAETLLVHRNVARTFLPKVSAVLLSRNVELRGDDAARRIVPEMRVASEQDWCEEYLDLILAVRVVDDVATAIDHIENYGSHHSDSIISKSEHSQQLFRAGVNSAVVYVNASTRFTDGGEFGMGAEIGISTDKLHARGPVGVEELTTYKYIVTGNGQIRA